MYNRKVLLIALGLVFSTSALADRRAEEILMINEEIAIINARVGKADAEVKLATKQQELNKLNGSSTTNTNDLPVVRSIEGVDGKLLATLATNGGITQTVSKGGKFGAWTVTKIDVSAVTLSRGKEVVKLGFGSEPPTSAQGVGINSSAIR